MGPASGRGSGAWTKVLLPGALMLGAAAVPAHEVEDTVTRAQATVVTIHYADGTTFAGQSYELRAEGADRAVASGVTDSRGRAVLLLDGPGPWRFRSFSDDGHGVERSLAGPAAAASTADAAPAAITGPDRGSRIVLGLGVVLALFGALQLWLRRR